VELTPVSDGTSTRAATKGSTSDAFSPVRREMRFGDAGTLVSMLLSITLARLVTSGCGIRSNSVDTQIASLRLVAKGLGPFRHIPSGLYGMAKTDYDPDAPRQHFGFSARGASTNDVHCPKDVKIGGTRTDFCIKNARSAPDSFTTHDANDERVGRASVIPLVISQKMPGRIRDLDLHSPLPFSQLRWRPQTILPF
jgi:hypothetical protein